MNTYSYPTNAELISVAQKFLPQLELSAPVLSMFPRRAINESMLIWEQKDNYQGLMKARGYNGSPGKINPVGISRYTMQPGVYGGFAEIDEAELTIRREEGTFNQPMDLSSQVMERTIQVTNAQVQLEEYLVWTLLASGTFTSTDAKGAVIDAKSFTQRIYTAAVTYATHATATPLADFSAVALMHRGFSVRFDKAARAMMNLGTANDIRLNTNAADLGGKRRDFGATFNSLKQVNEVFLENDLPQMETYDEGYYDDNGVFQLYIPNNVIIVKGARTDAAPPGEWLQTRNAHNFNQAPGTYQYVEDSMGKSPPRYVRVHRGFNGGPVVEFPSAIVIIQC